MRRTVALFLFDDVETLDFAGPYEVFSVADELSGGCLFDVRTVAPKAGALRTVHGLRVLAEHGPGDCPRPDILVIPGGAGTRALIRDSVIIDWIRSCSAQAELTMSVCTGALLLAQAGLLGGLTVTTHHDVVGMLRKLAPSALVVPGKRFHDNGRVLTAAGISAGIDAALHVVARMAGGEMAERTSTYMEYERGR